MNQLSLNKAPFCILTLLILALIVCTGTAFADYKEPVITPKTPLSGTGELLINPDFEISNSDGSAPVNWVARGGFGSGKYFSWDSTYSKSGNKSVKLKADTSASYVIYQHINNIIPRAEYQAGVWADIDNIGPTDTACIRIECYSGSRTSSETYLCTIGSDIRRGNGLGWTKFLHEFTAPENCKTIIMYFKVLGSGTAYIDDASLIQTGEPEFFSMNTDWTFYYSDMDKIKVSADININQYSNLMGCSAVFNIKDGQEVLSSKEIIIYSGLLTAEFNVSILAVKKEYGAEVIIKDSTSTEIARKSMRIFKYDRPEYLREDGSYVEDNKVLNPVITMGIPGTNAYDAVASVGTTIAITYATTTLDILDKIQAAGMKAAIILFGGFSKDGKFLTAGHPEKIENTKAKVAELMNHPAVFGWGIMDEPFAHYAYPEKYLIDSYRAVHDIDDKHPIFMVEINRDKYREAVKYCDIFTPDIYPGDAPDKLAFFEERFKFAVENSGGKPTYATVQAFDYLGYYPTGDDMRNMIYQTFLSGGKGIAYYAFSSSQGNLNLDKTSLGEGLKEFFHKEQTLAFDILVNNKYTETGKYENSDIVWRTWENENKIYVLALNKKSSSINEAAFTVPNAKLNSKIRIINGGSVDEAVFTGSTLTVDLAPGQVVLYEITPPSDGSSITFCKNNFIMDTLEEGSLSASYHYVSEKTSSVVALVVLYSVSDNIKKLESVKLTKTEVLSAGQTYDFDVPVEITGAINNSYILKAFLLESLELQKPLTQSAEIN